MRSPRSILPPIVAVAGLLAALASPAGAARTLPCLPQLDGRCEEWSLTYDGAGDRDAIRAVTTAPDGMLVYGAGETTTPDGIRLLTIAADAATGELRWAKLDGREGDAYDSSSSVVTSPDGSILYVAGSLGRVTTDGSTFDALLVARDAATGDPLWSAIIDGEGQSLDSAQAVVAGADGDLVFLGGQTTGPEGHADYLVAAFDAETGERAWISTYDGGSAGTDRGADLVLAGEAVVLTGRSADAEGTDDIVTVAFGAEDGDHLWTNRYANPGSDDAFAAAADAAGERIVVAGEAAKALPGMDPITIAYGAATGDRLWVARYANPPVAGGTLFDVAISPDGETAVSVGYTQRSDGKGPSTIAYRVDTGQQLWGVNLQEGSSFAAAISPDGRRAYVTGGSYDRRGPQHRTISYLVGTGEQRWAGLYHETAPPAGLRSTLLQPDAIAISPDGTDVYVAGAVRDLGAEHDDALILSYHA